MQLTKEKEMQDVSRNKSIFAKNIFLSRKILMYIPLI